MNINKKKAYNINENFNKNILLAKEIPNTELSDRIDDFLNEAKHKVDEVKAVVEDVKEVLDETIEIEKELSNLGDHVVKVSSLNIGNEINEINIQNLILIRLQKLLNRS